MVLPSSLMGFMETEEIQMFVKGARQILFEIYQKAFKWTKGGTLPSPLKGNFSPKMSGIEGYPLP